MKVGKFDITVVYKVGEEVKHRTITHIAMSEIQMHVPPGAEIVSAVAKRHPNHKLGE